MPQPASSDLPEQVRVRDMTSRTEDAPVRRGVAFFTLAMAVGATLAGFVAATVALPPVAWAQSGGDGVAYDEAQAQSIDRMLMCPVCPAQTIDQTEVALAKQMRAQVRELLASGATRDEVLAWFSAPERYGPSVLAEPPRSGINLLAWIVPGVVVIAGLAGGVLTLRAMRGRETDPGSDAPPHDGDDLQPYLSAVDRDLALDDDPERDDHTERGGLTETSRG